MTGEQAYEWLAPKLSKPEREALDVLRAENEALRAALSGAVTVLDSLRTYGLAKYDCAQSRSGSLVYVAPTIDEAKELLTPNAAFSRPPE